MGVRFQPLIVLILLLVLFAAYFSFVQAGSGELRVRPAMQQVFLDDGGNSKIPLQNLVLENQGTQEVTLVLSGIEFTSIDAAGGNIFLGQDLQSESVTKRADWIQLSTPEIFLAPGEEKEVFVTIKNGSTLSPGAHYGAVLIEPRSSQKEGQEAPEVSIRHLATSLLYISKGVGDLGKTSADTLQYFQSFGYLPEVAVATFVQAGESFVEPRGYASITNPFGSEVTRAIFNPQGKIVFPGQTRQIEANFSKKMTFVPGKYTITLSYRYDDGDYQKLSRSFWYWESFAFLLLFFSAGGILVGVIRKKYRQ
jgi:hypothetical protein